MEKNTAPPPYSAYPAQPPPAGFVPQPEFVPSPQQVPLQTTVIVGSTTNYGPEPLTTTCPHCRHQIRSQIQIEATSKTHLYALILCLVGCWPCVCVPYCVDSCQNTNHYCPNCKAYLGSYSS